MASIKTQINPKRGIAKIDHSMKSSSGERIKATIIAIIQLMRTAADPSRLRTALTEVSEGTL
jgi:hypothetical protein